MDIKGKAAIVTGGASGLGVATAELLSAHGAKVTIFDLNADLGTAKARELGGHFAPVNVTDEAAVESAFQEAEGLHGKARIFDADPLDDDGERGVIVNTASVAAFDGQIGQSAYAASEGGIVAMALPIAREFARYGIRVNTIAPGIFWTPLLASLPQDAQDLLGRQVPFPSRLGRPAEFAMMVESIVTNTMLNGEVIRLDGAIRMAPK